VIRAAQYRTQEQNHFDPCIGWLNCWVRPPKSRARKATHPTIIAKARRLASKKQHGEIKHLRRYHPDDWE